MKIGVLFTCYNCESYVDDCLAPWLKLRDEYNFVIAASSSMFSDYLKLGISEKNEGTLSKLISKHLDFLVTTSGKNLLDEEANRNLCLDFLKKQDCDLIILLDGDEVYTETQISMIFDVVLSNPEPDGYKVNFKNYTIHKNLFLYEFCHARIFWTKRHGGIEKFHFDNEFFYANDRSLKPVVAEIAKEVAYVNHYSWLQEDSRSRDKILYQNGRYGGHDGTFPVERRCSFVWNEEQNRLEFNPEYWKNVISQLPVLHECVEGLPFCFDFELNFNRKNNTVTIDRVSKAQLLKFAIYDEETKSIYVCDVDAKPGGSYWINPNVDIRYDELENFKKFRIEAYVGDQLVHAEMLHLKSH